MARFYRSRHSNLDILTDDFDLQYLPLRKLLKLTNTANSIVISIGVNENLPMIAGLIWGNGNENLWWIIADYNDIRDPMNLEVGQILYIPPLDRVFSLINDINLR